MRVLGIVLIVLGAIGLAIKGFSYTREETVVDVGPIEATAETQETVPIPVWVSGIVLAAGVVLLVTSKRSNA
ncbi:MAG: hypothetical protein ACREL7_10500 [Longimicrobiales bacterium]